MVRNTTCGHSIKTKKSTTEKLLLEIEVIIPAKYLPLTMVHFCGQIFILWVFGIWTSAISK